MRRCSEDSLIIFYLFSCDMPKCFGLMGVSGRRQSSKKQEHTPSAIPLDWGYFYLAYRGSVKRQMSLAIAGSVALRLKNIFAVAMSSQKRYRWSNGKQNAFQSYHAKPRVLRLLWSSFLHINIAEHNTMVSNDFK